MIEILILNSNHGIRKQARNALTESGFRVVEAASTSDGPAAVAADSPELVLLEWRGSEQVRELIEELNSSGKNGAIQVIVVADQRHREESAVALEFGAADCLFHPFGSKELLARVRAVLRRPAAANAERVSAGPILLDKAGHRAFVDGNPMELAPAEFRLLRFLLENQGRVFSRQELLARAWREEVRAGPRTVDVHIRRLRQVLEPYTCADMIQTVRGFGYRFSTLTYRPEKASNRARSAPGRT